MDRAAYRLPPPSCTISYRCTSRCPHLHNQLQVHFLLLPVTQSVTGAPHPAPQLHNQLQVYLLPFPSCTTSYRCTSSSPPVAQPVRVTTHAAPIAQPVIGAPHPVPQLHKQLQVHFLPPPQLHNQLQVYLLPPPVTQPVKGAHHPAPQLHHQLQVHFMLHNRYFPNNCL